jgi:hypothetical protein
MDTFLKVNRRQLLESGLVIIGLFWLSQSITGCGGSGNGGGSGYGGGGGSAPPTTPGNCDQNGSPVETTGITESHTHTIQLSAAEIQAANPSAVFTTSNVGHTHPVQLTAQQYADLQANQSISLVTGPGGDGHSHTLTLSCA